MQYSKTELNVTMPVLALRGLTIFPNMPLHFDVGRPQSIQALEDAMESGSAIFLVGQKELLTESPQREDLWDIGTVSTVRQILRLPGDNVRVMVEGTTRGRLVHLVQTQPFLRAEVQELHETALKTVTPHTEAMIRNTYEKFERYAELNPKLTPDILLGIISSTDPGYIADYIAQNLTMRNEDKQRILSELRSVQRLRLLNQTLGREIDIMLLEKEMAEKTRDRMNENQRDYYLREQMKAIRGELGEEGEDDADDYRRKIIHAKLPCEVEEKLLKEAERLKKQPFGSSEAAVTRNYLDVCLELPWGKYTKERTDVEAAEKILNAGHYGMGTVKERILEFLAVKQLAPELKGQIICLVGPPGVGKTSIAASVAKATNRKMARISLGGVHDEAEIRGHRKTYVGAMPGRIINAVGQAGSQNPLLLLDEIDKLGNDHRGDPSSALLEVLDSAQNHTFRDHFIELPFDLSDVLFILTANTLDTIPRPLLDRMEVIELSSYTDEEKVEIAKRHLLPKQRIQHGLKARQLKVDDAALRALITGYTKESGVRLLERQLAALCRKTAKYLVTAGEKQVTIKTANLSEWLGAPRYLPDLTEKEDEVGLVNGLAWTSVGGELLRAEVNVVPGSGKVLYTGNLGDVMKESCQAALSYLRSRTEQLKLPEDFHKTKDIHVHFPEGAVPKDGPSAGVTITTAIASALTGIPVRQNVAMTGEVTLRGRVLPIGGLREKTMAALRSGIHTVIIPAENRKDIEEIDPLVREQLSFVTVSHVDEVLELALCRNANESRNETEDSAAEIPCPPIAERGGGRLNLTQ